MDLYPFRFYITREDPASLANLCWIHSGPTTEQVTQAFSLKLSYMVYTELEKMAGGYKTEWNWIQVFGIEPSPPQ